MSLLRVGSTEKYSANWAKAFGIKASQPKPQKVAKSAAARTKKNAKPIAKAPKKKARRR